MTHRIPTGRLLRWVSALTIGGAGMLALLGADGPPRELRVGVAGHAFDHLGNLGEQADAAAASGATIIYATGLGGDGYSGLPDAATLKAHREAAAEYLRKARSRGIRLAIGYLCATSIVTLESFDRNWSPDLRARLHTPPSDWRQQDAEGRPLPSWYGGEYQPACMNHPDWRAYQKFMVGLQLEAGHDGIFFDNPTVHPRGCYCRHCMTRFAAFLKGAGVAVADATIPALRRLAHERSRDFLRFRCTIASDFLAEMRTHARSLNPRALVTCNNSLNAVSAFYSQCRTYGYNIHELSRSEDLVVVEDMGNQPRVLADGRTLEYGPTYRLLHAVSRGRPVVAVTLADADYRTPPNLVRLAMAEAAAHDASYLAWPTWPPEQRARMIAAIRPQAELLRASESLLNDTRARRDLVLLFPFRRWTETADCAATRVATELTRRNLQFEVVNTDDLRAEQLEGVKVVVTESLDGLTAGEADVLAQFRRKGGRVVVADRDGWTGSLREAIERPAVVVHGPATLRAVVRDQPGRTIVHLFNLNVRCVSSFEDQVVPANGVRVECRVPFARVRSVRALTADAESGPVTFTAGRDGESSLVTVAVPRVAVGTMLLIEE